VRLIEFFPNNLETEQAIDKAARVAAGISGQIVG